MKDELGEKIMKQFVGSSKRHKKLFHKKKT